MSDTSTFKVEIRGVNLSNLDIAILLRSGLDPNASVSVSSIGPGHEMRIVNKDASMSALSTHDGPIIHGPHDNKKVVVAHINKYGKVLIALDSIYGGETVAVFDGEIKTVPRSAASLLPNDPPIFFRAHAIMIDKNTWQDSNGIARYASHSCNPNCGIKNLREIVAMKYIKAGEQITWDYSMTEDPEANDFEMDCVCGEKECRRVIRGYRYLPPIFRDRYKGYVSEWLEPRYVVEQ